MHIQVAFAIVQIRRATQPKASTCRRHQNALCLTLYKPLVGANQRRGAFTHLRAPFKAKFIATTRQRPNITTDHQQQGARPNLSTTLIRSVSTSASQHLRLHLDALKNVCFMAKGSLQHML